MEKMTWIDAHKNERFGNNRNASIFSECKTCKWKDKAVGGYMKFTCDVYPQDDQKPLFLLYNGDCDFYEKG